MEIKRLNAHFGAEVLGIDLRDSANNDLIRTLTQAVYENRVIIIRNQSLTEENYLKFGRHWGAPIPHVLDHLRMPRHPALMVVGNTEEKDQVETVRNGTALWHTDQSYEAIPASATMLYAIKVPLLGAKHRSATWWLLIKILIRLPSEGLIRCRLPISMVEANYDRSNSQRAR